MLGVRPPPPTSQISIKLQFGVPVPGTVPPPGVRGVLIAGADGVKVGVTVRVDVNVGVLVTVAVLVAVRVDVAV
jgi:hypothetical protein